MRDNYALQELRQQQEEVATQGAAECAEAIAICESAIDLFAETWTHLEGISFGTDSQEEASRLVSWRFICSIPNTAMWCLDSARKGQHGVSAHLLRLLLEETVSLAYYASFPEAAFERIQRRHEKDKLPFGQKLEALAWPNARSLKKLHGMLSNLYSHGNAVLRRVDVLEDEKGGRSLLAGPVYSREGLGFCATTVSGMLAMVLGHLVLGPFPELQDSHGEWMKRVGQLTAKVGEGHWRHGGWTEGGGQLETS